MPLGCLVVSYRNSTSNHNTSKVFASKGLLYLIEILHQTTTDYWNKLYHAMLYLIEILHQTTTVVRRFSASFRCILSKFYIKPQQRLVQYDSFCRCILSKFYIKPQRRVEWPGRLPRCILSKFYIKPQRRGWLTLWIWVVSYRNSTSNHNGWFALCLEGGVVSYRNSTSNHNGFSLPYPGRNVVSYRNSTSNHNPAVGQIRRVALYLIEILHQTTTSGLILIDKVLLTGCLPL